MEAWCSGARRLTRVLRPYATWPVNQYSFFLLPPPPPSCVRTHTHHHGNMPHVPTSIRSSRSVTQTTHTPLSRQQSEECRHRSPSLCNIKHCDILEDLHICHLFKGPCHLRNAKWAHRRKGVKPWGSRCSMWSKSANTLAGFHNLQPAESEISPEVTSAAQHHYIVSRSLHFRRFNTEKCMHTSKLPPSTATPFKYLYLLRL